MKGSQSKSSAAVAKRRPNFTDEEIFAIIFAVNDRKRLLLGTYRLWLPTDYGANDANTLKMGVRQQSPMKPTPRNQNG